MFKFETFCDTNLHKTGLQKKLNKKINMFVRSVFGIDPVVFLSDKIVDTGIGNQVRLESKKIEVPLDPTESIINEDRVDEAGY